MPHYHESPPDLPDRRRSRSTTIVGLALASLIPIGCAAKENSKSSGPSEVVAMVPVSAQVTDYADFTGRLDAVKTVEVRARVSGYLTDIPFKEGDIVKENDLLFQVDSRTYQADYNQAVANVKQAEAERKVQESNAIRARELLAKRAIAEEDYETVIATAEKAAATVSAMQAAKDRAKLYLDFTRVTASVSGRISRRNVDPGNLVKADDTLLTTIVTEDPMYAYFDVDERTFLDLTGIAARDTQSWMNGKQFQVVMRLANEDEYTHSGLVDFVDNRLSGSTGTMRMRGIFENPNRLLKAGMFVRVRLPIGTPYTATLIPDEAILSDQGRKCAYVINDKSIVEYRRVTLGQSLQGLRVIKSGINMGDRVVVAGMQRVKPKAEVQVKMKEPPKPPVSPLTKQIMKDRDILKSAGG